VAERPLEDGKVADVLRATVAEIKGFREAVTRLADKAETFVPRDEFDAALTERTFRRHQLILTVVALFLVFLAGTLGFYKIAEEVRQGMRCSIEQMVEHRVADRLIERRKAEVQGIKLDETGLPPLPNISLERLDACDRYEITRTD